MKLKRSIYKDLKLRKTYYKYESALVVLKALTFNGILPLSIRQAMYEVLHNLSIKSTRIRNRCLYTGRGRGVMPEFRISRIEFKNLADKGLIPGVKRAS
jgi:ribosomal protein S14